MERDRINGLLYQNEHRTVLGFHGCDRSVAMKVLKDATAHLVKSDNPWDWLGKGIYFWLNDPIRAFEWAEDYKKRKKLKDPFVIGAVIDLGLCMNLCERDSTKALRKSYEELKAQFESTGVNIDEKLKNEGSDSGGYRLYRYLDCAVVDNYLNKAEDKGIFYDSVLGYFQEGEDAYPGAGIKEKSHIQICVRNTDCIKGYFLPRAVLL